MLLFSATHFLEKVQLGYGWDTVGSFLIVLVSNCPRFSNFMIAIIIIIICVLICFFFIIC